MNHQLFEIIVFKILFILLSVYMVDAAWRLPGKAMTAGQMRLNSLPDRQLSGPDRQLSGTIIPSLMTETKNILSFLHTIEHLKLEKRTGWHQEGIPYEKSESIADHMYRMAIMVCVVQDDTINKFKALKMALVHDMAEALVGDITPACGVSEEEKNRLETAAMQSIRDVLGDNPFGVEAQELWLEYAADTTKESQFVKDIDKTELYVQVVEYENKFNINFQHWLSRARPKIRHPALQAIADEAEKQRPENFLAAKLQQDYTKVQKICNENTNNLVSLDSNESKPEQHE